MKTPRSPRKTPRQTRARDTVAAILEAAAHIFSKVGFDKATTNDVAERAGVSIGSLYQYFPNKLAILEAVRQRHVKGMWAALGAACESGHRLPWPDALRRVVTASVTHNSGHYPLLATIHRELPLQAPLSEPMRLDRLVFQNHLRRFFTAHRASIKVDVDRAVFILPALSRGIFGAAVVESPENLNNGVLVEELTAAILGYLEGSRSDVLQPLAG